MNLLPYTSWYNLHCLQHWLLVISILTRNEQIFCLVFLVADEFQGVFHSLDVWHKSKSIRKCLAKVISFPTKTVLHMTHSSDLLKSEEQDFTVASKTNIRRNY